MTSKPPPRRRPPWWPETEQWPPADWSGYGWGRGRGRNRHSAGPPMFFRIGCTVIFLVVLLSVAFNVMVWILATVTGLFGAPTLPSGALVGILLGTAIAGYVAYR